MSVQNIISVSGGKDSTATLLLAIERQAENLQAVFADTGHEHVLTYEYLDYLQDKTGVFIQRVKADFTRQINAKRKYIEEHWRSDGVPNETIAAALEILHPTGNPFLDLCLWKGRFPSTKARFCTEELKVVPIMEQIIFPILDNTQDTIESWQGVRRDESRSRAHLDEREGMEPNASRVFAYRPILDWTAHEGIPSETRHQMEPALRDGHGPRGVYAVHKLPQGRIAPNRYSPAGRNRPGGGVGENRFTGEQAGKLYILRCRN